MSVKPRAPEKKAAVEAFRDWALDVLVEELRKGSQDGREKAPTTEAAPQGMTDTLVQQTRLLAETAERMGNTKR